MSLTPAVVAEIQSAGHYGICVATTLFTYDYFLTLQEEKRLVWDARWSWGKALFLLIRYTGFPVMIGFCWAEFSDWTSQLSCSVIIYLLMGSTMVIIHCSGLVLALRTWAVWDRNLICGIILALAWISITVLSTVFLVYSTLGIITDGNTLFSPAYQFTSSGCMPINTPTTALAALHIYICLATYEGLIFVLTIARGLKYFYDSNPTLLMMILYRDAFIASACLLAMTITNATLNSMNSTQFDLPYLIGTAFYFIVPCRIILNLRAATRSYVDNWDLATTVAAERRVDHIALKDMDHRG